MLELLRRYQSYIFIIVAVVVIISFSFFGTYNTLPADRIHEQIVFTTIDGTKIKRSEIEDLVLFLTTDTEDKLLYGGIWGPNFLNDGVIKNDFLATGLADILIEAYAPELSGDLNHRLTREKNYRLYQHPQAQFLSTATAWAYFAPAMKENLEALQKANSAIDPNAIAARRSLFLEERKFPAPLLKQVLRYQQKQYQWIDSDPNLERADLSLFGYHNVEDWFGPRFMRLIAQFIINSSQIAEQKGYRVSKEEAMAELLRNADHSFQQNAKNPHLDVNSSLEYLNEQLRHLGMDKNKAVKVWRQVLLFRRLFHDLGNSVVVDALSHQKFADYASETATGDLYRLPAEFRFGDYRTLQKFEIYLNAISKRSEPSIQIPSKLLSIEEVKKEYPELVQKRYELGVAQIQKNALKSKISLKELWNWEGEAENWEKLKSQFPELGTAEADSRDRRMAVLDHLDDATRSRVDAYAKSAIIDQHPKWLDNALEEAEIKPLTIGLSTKQKALFVKGLTNSEELTQLLDKAPLKDQLSKDKSEEEAAQRLSQYTADKNHIYKIVVYKRFPKEEILTFAEANREGILDPLLDQKLESYYEKNRDKSPSEFQKEDKSWKPFSDVKGKVADLYFEKILKEITKDYAKGLNEKEKKLTNDQIASLRFFAFARQIKEKLKKGSTETANLIRDSASVKSNERVEAKDQWKLERIEEKFNRSTPGKEEIDKEEILALAPGTWTNIHTPINGNLYFFSLNTKEAFADPTTFSDNIYEEHKLLSYAAQRFYMKQFLEQIKSKNAISLNFMNTSNEETID